MLTILAFGQSSSPSASVSRKYIDSAAKRSPQEVASPSGGPETATLKRSHRVPSAPPDRIIKKMLGLRTPREKNREVASLPRV